jgi:hypothetical protein
VLWSLSSSPSSGKKDQKEKEGAGLIRIGIENLQDEVANISPYIDSVNCLL